MQPYKLDISLQVDKAAPSNEGPAVDDNSQAIFTADDLTSEHPKKKRPVNCIFECRDKPDFGNDEDCAEEGIAEGVSTEVAEANEDGDGSETQRSDLGNDEDCVAEGIAAGVSREAAEANDGGDGSEMQVADKQQVLTAAEAAGDTELLRKRKDELEDEVVYLKKSFNEVVSMLEVLGQRSEISMSPSAPSFSGDTQHVFTADGYSDALPTKPHPSGSPPLIERGSEFAAPSPPNAECLSPPGLSKASSTSAPFPWITSPWKLITGTISPESISREEAKHGMATGRGGDAEAIDSATAKSQRREILFGEDCGAQRSTDMQELRGEAMENALFKARALLIRSMGAVPGPCTPEPRRRGNGGDDRMGAIPPPCTPWTPAKSEGGPAVGSTRSATLLVFSGVEGEGGVVDLGVAAGTGADKTRSELEIERLEGEIVTIKEAQAQELAALQADQDDAAVLLMQLASSIKLANFCSGADVSLSLSKSSSPVHGADAGQDGPSSPETLQSDDVLMSRGKALKTLVEDVTALHAKTVNRLQADNAGLGATIEGLETKIIELEAKMSEVSVSLDLCCLTCCGIPRHEFGGAHLGNQCWGYAL